MMHRDPIRGNDSMNVLPYVIPREARVNALTASCSQNLFFPPTLH